MADVAASLQRINARIAAACERAGRSPGEVRLMPVSKTQPSAAIRSAYAAGVRILGENRVQEAATKARECADLSDLHWAMIGHLQTNKVKEAIEFASEFHALDSLRIADALDRHLQGLGRGLDVFLQVNSSDEPQKYGLPPEEIPALAAGLRDHASLRVRGLMTLAVLSSDAEQVAACFRRMQELQARLRDRGDLPGSYDELSMGMSGDFELAIGYGATTVRVGEAIFGARLTPARP
jgi:PLP dependent protein